MHSFVHIIWLLFVAACIATLFFQFVALGTYAFILPRFKPGWAKTISGYGVRFFFKRMPGYGLAAHMDGGRQLTLEGFHVEDGVIHIGEEPYFPVDEAPVGSALGIPFIATYRGFAGLVNMGLAKVGEEIERYGLEARSDTAAADGGAVTMETRQKALKALEKTADELDEDTGRLIHRMKSYLRAQTQRTKGTAITIPDHAVVDTSKIQYIDSNASIPDKAARAVKNAEARAREEMGMTPMKMAMLLLGAFALGAGVVILALVLIGSVGGSGGGGATLAITAGVLL